MKLGDKVSAQYGDVTVVGTVYGFSGGWVMLKFSSSQDLGNRIETDGVGIRPSDRATIKVIEAGPELTWDDVVEVPGHGHALRAA